MPEFENDAMTLRELHSKVKTLARRLVSWFENYYSKDDTSMMDSKTHFEDAVEVLQKIYDDLYDFAYLDQFACNILKNIAMLMESVVNQNLEYFLFNVRDQKKACNNLKWIMSKTEQIYEYNFM